MRSRAPGRQHRRRRRDRRRGRRAGRSSSRTTRRPACGRSAPGRASGRSSGRRRRSASGTRLGALRAAPTGGRLRRHLLGGVSRRCRRSGAPLLSAPDGRVLRRPPGRLGDAASTSWPGDGLASAVGLGRRGFALAGARRLRRRGLRRRAALALRSPAPSAARRSSSRTGRRFGCASARRRRCDSAAGAAARSPASPRPDSLGGGGRRRGSRSAFAGVMARGRAASATETSLRMSIRQPVSFAASRAFWPSRPMASESIRSGTVTLAIRCSSSIVDADDLRRAQRVGDEDAPGRRSTG